MSQPISDLKNLDTDKLHELKKILEKQFLDALKNNNDCKKLHPLKEQLKALGTELDIRAAAHARKNYRK